MTNIQDIFRFITKIEMKASNPQACWDWTGTILASKYGAFWLDGKSRRAHRVAYTHWKGPIQYEIDHVCKNKRCVNPTHLEDVTHIVNSRRGPFNYKRQQCKRGHLLVKGNLYMRKNGGRSCRTCGLAYANERNRRIREVKG